MFRGSPWARAAYAGSAFHLLLNSRLRRSDTRKRLQAHPAEALADLIGGCGHLYRFNYKIGVGGVEFQRGWFSGVKPAVI